MVSDEGSPLARKDSVLKKKKGKHGWEKKNKSRKEIQRLVPLKPEKYKRKIKAFSLETVYTAFSILNK